MPQSFTIGGLTYTMRPRSLSLDLELGGDDGPRARMRGIRMESLRLGILRDNAQRRMLALAEAPKAPGKAALDNLIAEINGYDTEREGIDVQEMEAMIAFVEVVLRDSDGNPPPVEALRDTDLDVISEVLDAVAGIPPTGGED